MKTFKDLEFKDHPIAISAKKAQKNGIHMMKDMLESKQAVITFDNGVRLSVVISSIFYSNGVDTYEAYQLGLDGNEPRGYLTKDEVTEYMKELQLKPDEHEFKLKDYVVTPMGDIILYEDSSHINKEDLKLWTFEEADDDEWVLAKFGSPICLMSVKDVKRQIDQMNNPRDCVPYICQTPEQLGLEK